MTLPALCMVPPAVAKTTLTSAFSHGSDTTVVVSDPSILGSPTVTMPLRFTLVKAGAISSGIITNGAQAATYQATGLTSHTLSGVTYESGTNQDFSISDVLALTDAPGYLIDVHRRIRWQPVNVMQFGTVVGDGVTDDGPAIQAIINAFPGRSIYFPRTATSSDFSNSYYLANTMMVLHPGTTLYGDGGGYGGGTVIQWAAKTPGIWIIASGCSVRGMCLVGSEPWVGTHYDEGIIPAKRYTGLTEKIGASGADGIRIGAPYNRIEDLNFLNWGRDAVNFSAGDQNQSGGLGAEDCQIDRMFGGNCRGNGLRIQGGDSNVTVGIGSTYFVNQMWAIDASDFLGFTAICPQATQNGFDASEQLAGSGDPTNAIATLVRSSNTVTLTWTAPYTSGDGSPIPVGAGVRVTTCPNDTSFVGRWRVLSVASDHTSLTYTQVESDASTTGGTGRANFLPPDGTITSAVRTVTAAPVTGNGTTVTSSAIITSLPTTTGIEVGMTIAGTYTIDGSNYINIFPPDTTVLSVDSSTQITVSDPAFASVTRPITAGYPWYPAALVTLTTNTALLTDSSGHQALSGQPFKVGQGISVLNCPDSSFNGTFVVLSVTNSNRTVTYAQTGSGATITSGTCRMAIPYDVWQLTWSEYPNDLPPQKIQGGSFRSPFGTAPSVWINPYAEGGQRLRLGRASVVIAPTWSDPFDRQDIGEALVLYGASPNTGAPGTNRPLGLVFQHDEEAGIAERLGLTDNQKLVRYRQQFDDGMITLWKHEEGPGFIRTWVSNPDTDINAIKVQDLDLIHGNATFNRLVIGNGTTGQRPATNLAIGMTRFNTTTGKPEWWDGSGWVLADGTSA